MIKSTISQFSKSIGLNKDEYITKEGASFSLFKVEISVIVAATAYGGGAMVLTGS